MANVVVVAVAAVDGLAVVDGDCVVHFVVVVAVQLFDAVVAVQFIAAAVFDIVIVVVRMLNLWLPPSARCFGGCCCCWCRHCAKTVVF